MIDWNFTRSFIATNKFELHGKCVQEGHVYTMTQAYSLFTNSLALNSNFFIFLSAKACVLLFCLFQEFRQPVLWLLAPSEKGDSAVFVAINYKVYKTQNQLMSHGISSHANRITKQRSITLSAEIRAPPIILPPSEWAFRNLSPFPFWHRNATLLALQAQKACNTAISCWTCWRPAAC